MKRLLTTAIFLALIPVAIIPIAFADNSSDPSDAIFLIRTTDRDAQDGKVKTHGFGTGFFISKDGTALTASHVVYRVLHDPKKYRAIAVVGKEFYDMQVVCASNLPYDATAVDRNHGGIPVSRDVAQVRLIPSTAYDGKKDTLFYFPKNGEPIPLATAHVTALPDFPFLTIGGHGQVGSRVRVIGFGNISAIPHVWTAPGQVDQTWTSRVDGTRVFDIVSANPAVPGDSGAPVLDDQNQVVGLWAWHYNTEPTRGVAEDSSVLENPCK